MIFRGVERKKGRAVSVGVLVIVVGFVLFELLWLKFYGSAVPRPQIARGEQVLGSGPSLRYVVMGDSTTVAQGGDYKKGYAVATAAYLAQTHRVAWQNLGEAGARAGDVLEHQLPQAAASRPDVVLIAVGANDVTHLTRLGDVYASLAKTISVLQKTNAKVRIILTGSPDMGSLRRLPQPLRWLAGVRTKALNAKLAPLIREPQVVFAPIADKTGPVFRAHPELLAADKFHPTTAGYKLWTPVLIEAMQRAGLH